MTEKQTRGIRNNNPLNIRKGSPWVGLSPRQTDASFCQFVDIPHGVRAACKILQTYAGRGVYRVATIIASWAPEVENNTRTYIDAVCKRTGFLPSTIVWPHDETCTVALLLAMAFVECNHVFDEKDFREGYRLAQLR